MGPSELKRDLDKLADPRQAERRRRFFKAGPGEYAEGDVFLGLTVPQQRAVAANYRHLTPNHLSRLLSDPVHECRAAALFILIHQYQRADAARQKEIFEFYLDHRSGVNHWDLVDVSAPKIVGHHLLDKKRDRLRILACADDLWTRRISIVSTLAFIKHGQVDDTLGLAEILMADEHDLIHKAVGWMLRESAKRDPERVERFLERYHREMPRTMLRYAIEGFSEKKRSHYLKKK